MEGESLDYVKDDDKENLVVQEKKAKRLASVGEKITIVDDLELEMAQSWLVGAKRFTDELEVQRTKITQPINLGLRGINKLFGRISGMVENPYMRVSQAVIDYREKKRKEAEEKKRKDDEIARKFEDDQKKALESQAKELEKKGNAAAADNLREVAKTIVAPVAQKNSFTNTAEAGGGSVGGRKKLTIIVDNKPEFIKFVISKGDLWHLLDINESEIKTYAKAHKLVGVNTIPGLTIVSGEGLIIKTK